MSEEIVHYHMMIEAINERLYSNDIDQSEFESLVRLKEELLKGMGI